jgi:hypothetical protein
VRVSVRSSHLVGQGERGGEGAGEGQRGEEAGDAGHAAAEGDARRPARVRASADSLRNGGRGGPGVRGG